MICTILIIGIIALIFFIFIIKFTNVKIFGKSFNNNYTNNNCTNNNCTNNNCTNNNCNNENFTNNEDDKYITYNNQNFIKSKIKTCDIITSPVTFPVGTTLEEALEICSQETELGGHGQCIGILPFNKRNKMYAGDDTIYPWIGCLSTSYYDDCENSIVEGTWLNIDNEDVNNYMWA